MSSTGETPVVVSDPPVGYGRPPSGATDLPPPDGPDRPDEAATPASPGRPMLPVLLAAAFQATLVGAVAGALSATLVSVLVIGSGLGFSVDLSTENLVGASWLVAYGVVTGVISGCFVGLCVGGVVGSRGITSDDPKARRTVALWTLLFVAVAGFFFVTPMTIGFGLVAMPLVLLAAPAIGAWRARSITDVRRTPEGGAPRGVRPYVPMVLMTALPVLYAGAVVVLGYGLSGGAVDWDETGDVDRDVYLPLVVLTAPASLGFPWEVATWRDLDWVGVGLVLVGLGQAGVLAAAAWWRITGRRVLPALLALCMVAGIATVNVQASERATLDLPDRADASVAAEEARIAAAVTASGKVVIGAQAACEARLLEQRPDRSWAMVRCSAGAGEGAGEALMAVRVRSDDKVRVVDLDGMDGIGVTYGVPIDVARAVVLRPDDVRP